MKSIYIVIFGLLMFGCSSRQDGNTTSSSLAVETTSSSPVAPINPVNDGMATSAGAEERPLSSAGEIWPGIRVGSFVYAMVGTLGGAGAPPASAEMEDLGRVVRDGVEEPMEFLGWEEEPPEPSVATVFTPDASPCIGEVRRRIGLSSRCSDPNEGVWFEGWTALEIDCHTMSHESIVVPGAHPSATLSSAAFDELEVTMLEEGEDEPPDIGVFLRGSRIARIPNPAYLDDTQHLRVAGVSYLIVAWGAHGYGRAVFSIEPGPPRNNATFFYPAVTCGAF